MTKKPRIGYLGPQGTWSHQAAICHFPESELIACPSFDDIFEAVESNSLDYGILPIENSTYGFVSQTLDPLLTVSDITICNQSFLKIRNCLLSNGLKKEDIQTVYSHPQAIGQCRHWLKQHLPNAELISVSSTAAAAEIVKKSPNTCSAAIGSRLTAQLTGLNILQSDIQDDSENTTRFITIGKKEALPTENDRTSIYFCVPHQTGALLNVLSVFSKYAINLLCLDARPMRGKPWKYVFFTDVAGHKDTAPLNACLQELTTTDLEFKVLGSYPQNKDKN